VQCWGGDSYGVSSGPNGLTNIKSIAAGGLETCVIKADDSVQCWARNEYGQVPSDLGSVKSIAIGNHTCAIKADDSAVCWGGGIISTDKTVSQVI